jgi:hypothetical protein
MADKNTGIVTFTNDVLIAREAFVARWMAYRSALGIFGRNTASNPIAGR